MEREDLQLRLVMVTMHSKVKLLQHSGDVAISVMQPGPPLQSP